MSVAIQANRSFIKFEELSFPITYQNPGYFKPSFLPVARQVHHCRGFWISSILSAVGISGQVSNRAIIIRSRGKRLRRLNISECERVAMTPLSIFGLFAVTAMLVCYALEARSRWFILAFAGACALGSVYGFLQGAWPFGLVEAVWSVVAIVRWAKAHGSKVI